MYYFIPGIWYWHYSTVYSTVVLLYQYTAVDVFRLTHSQHLPLMCMHCSRAEHRIIHTFEHTYQVSHTWYHLHGLGLSRQIDIDS